jgi:two-component system OmpR family sensor kinase
MTLRLRLVLAIVGLTTVGLAVFGVTTYRLYARSQYLRLDQQLRDSIPLVVGTLSDKAECGISRSSPPGEVNRSSSNGGIDRTKVGAYRPEPGATVSPTTYAELRDASGAIVCNIALRDSTDGPSLATAVTLDGRTEVLYSTGGLESSTRWRVLVTSSDDVATGQSVVVAVPLSDVTDALHRLILIETAAGASLLAALAISSWFVMRRALRPLEHMASSARSITAGDLSERVSPANSSTEVGQLGLALNTMLDEIETAFNEREATEHRLRQFLADASHELRTPLTSIQGFAELFRLGGGTHPAVDQAVMMRRIEEESVRMKGLVEDLLLLARLDQTRPAVRAEVDLAVLAADACTDAAAASPGRSISLDAPAPVVVQGDPDHLRQAVANLVTNAIRHTPPGAAIEVSARIADGRAELRVRDHGPGLAPDALAHAFDRFWQADRARTGSGAGLGLSIVSGIAQEHDGTVEVANAADGGAVFIISLPVAP